ncbi:MAG: hypothetical protein R3F59_04680 [Myxococcota bacterium]
MRHVARRLGRALPRDERAHGGARVGPPAAPRRDDRVEHAAGLLGAAAAGQGGRAQQRDLRGVVGVGQRARRQGVEQGERAVGGALRDAAQPSTIGSPIDDSPSRVRHADGLGGDHGLVDPPGEQRLAGPREAHCSGGGPAGPPG